MSQSIDFLLNDQLAQALAASIFFCVIGNGIIALADNKDSLRVTDFINFFGIELCLQGIASDLALMSGIVGDCYKLKNIMTFSTFDVYLNSLRRGLTLLIFQIALLVFSAVVSRFSKNQWFKVGLSNIIGIFAIGLVFFLWH